MSSPDTAPSSGKGNSDDDLLTRVAKLEAINEIRNLIADYTHYFDTGWEGAGRDAAKVAATFTEDATWGGDSGVQRGRATIEAWCAKYGHTAQMSLHIAMNSKVEVTGCNAQGSWNGLIRMVTPDGQALWVGGRYECDFLHTTSGWKISRMNFLTAFQTPYDEGFARTRFVKPPSYKE
jgi:hypothetical protein